MELVKVTFDNWHQDRLVASLSFVGGCNCDHCNRPLFAIGDKKINSKEGS